MIQKKIDCAKYILAGNKGEPKRTRTGDEAFIVTLGDAQIEYVASKLA